MAYRLLGAIAGGRVGREGAIIAAVGGGYAVEQPHPWKGSVSMFDLESFKRLRKSHALSVTFDQCMYGQDTRKPTRIIFYRAHFEKLCIRCDHVEGHESVVGCRDDKGEYLTKRLAAYPFELNCAICRIIVEALKKLPH